MMLDRVVGEKYTGAVVLRKMIGNGREKRMGRGRSGKKRHTELIHIIFTRPQLVHNRVCRELVFPSDSPCFSHEHQFVARYLIFLNSLPNDSLAVAIGIDIRRVPLCTRKEQR